MAVAAPVSTGPVRYTITVAGESYNVLVEEDSGDIMSVRPSERTAAAPPPAQALSDEPALEICAQLPGNVYEVLVEVGDRVEEGDTIVILEAMKMETPVTVPEDGTIASIEVEKGHTVIGGADGPTAIFLSSQLSPRLLGSIAVAAYSYMALVPILQPPIMRLLTTAEERKIRMRQLRDVGKVEKIVFPLTVLGLCIFLLPSAAPLIGSTGVSAVPMAARVSQKFGMESDPQNMLLMHAMGPNVAGVIGSAVASGVLLTLKSFVV